MADILKELGYLAGATRFRRISEKLYLDGDKIYKDAGIDFKASWFSVFYVLAKNKKPLTIMEIAGQIDVGPTLIPLMGLSHLNNTLGVDLMKHNRPYMYFSADDKYGCISKDYFLVVRNIGTESLYHYENEDTRNYISEKPELADSMKHYAKSMIQTAQWMLLNKKTGDQE